MSRIAGALTLTAILVATLFLSAPTVQAASLQVHTQSGEVLGIAQGSTDQWRGIPYAAPPVGDLRWRPPAPVAPWTGVRDATEFAPPCIQPAFDAEGPAGTTGKEDCLYLNVFSPASASPTSDLAVMVHLHGGGNVFGSPYQDATTLVARNVIVVTLAYRLGVFGFLGHPALSKEGGGSSGEYGVLDQIAAMQWVHDNIAAFGGDPSNVTLFGLSAGSFDTVALMASPLTQGLLSRAAVQGDVFWALTGKQDRIRKAEHEGRHMFDPFDCGRGRKVLPCLRALPARALVRAGADAEVFDLLPWVGGAVLPRSPLKLLDSESSLPLLVGFDREEDRYFALPYPLPDPYTRKMWVNDTNELLGPSIAEQARLLYPPRAYGSRAWSFITLRTDAVRGCPTRRLANEVAAPTWRWLFTHTFENDPLLAEGRASHTHEEVFVWGNFDLFGAYTPTAAEELLSEQMVGYWTNYAKTGDPNGPGLPTWPRYDDSTEPTLILDDQVDVMNGYHVDQCGLLDSVDELYP